MDSCLAGERHPSDCESSGGPPGATMLAPARDCQGGEGAHREWQELSVKGLPPLVAVPQPDEVALALGLVGVAEGCPAMGEEPVVQILKLALLDRELDPVRR